MILGQQPTRVDGDGGTLAAAAELISSGLLYLGFAVLIASGVIRWFKGHWIRTTAVIFADDDAQMGLRWHGAYGDLGLATLPREQWAACVPGTEVTLYYLSDAPERWSLTSPHRLTRRLAILGTVLVICGIGISVPSLIDLMR